MYESIKLVKNQEKNSLFDFNQRAAGLSPAGVTTHWNLKTNYISKLHRTS